MRKTARPVVWEGGRAQSRSLDPIPWPARSVRETGAQEGACGPGGPPYEGRYNEHTHRRQVGLLGTSSAARNATPRTPFNTCSKDSSLIFPITSWKKHGRTAPSDSTTAETHGALQRGAS